MIHFAQKPWILLCVLMLAQHSAATSGLSKHVDTAQQPGSSDHELAELILDASEHFSDIESADLNGLLERIGDARLVLIGEASHGTAEFYDMRARITRALIEHKGFTIIAAEAEWPDAAVIDHYVRGIGQPPVVRYKPFGNFPSWLWRNESFNRFTSWLKNHNRQRQDPSQAIGFYGLDFYNMYGSIDALLNYLQRIDPAMASMAYRHYGCLMPWADNPANYSDFMESGRHRGCGHEVTAVLEAVLHRKDDYIRAGRHQFFNALQNAILVWKAEHYYRTRHQGIVNSWNLRDQSMFDTLLALLDFHGGTAKAVIWAHNTHVGDARATDMSEAGEINLGQLVRQAFADNAYLIGQGTDRGTVTAASKWGGKPTTIKVPPAQANSYEHLFHNVDSDNFLLPLSKPLDGGIRDPLLAPRLQRGIGSTYTPDPKKEIKYHYYQASLPLQFDEYIWFDESNALEPAPMQ